MFIAFFDSFKTSSGDKGSMFSIKYLYSIRNNFAIIYNGFDNTVKNKLLEKFKKIKTSENNIDLYLFMNDIEEKKELPELTQNLFYNACSYVSKMQNRKSEFDKEDEIYKSFLQFSWRLPVSGHFEL